MTQKPYHLLVLNRSALKFYFIFIFLFFILFFIYYSPNLIDNKYMLTNSNDTIKIKTFDGSGQSVHPCIIDFLNEYKIPDWGGFRYWMVITPYPYGNDSYEDPSIFASHNGMNWIVPSGVKNPLDDVPGGWDKGFNNDPNMVYNPDTNEIWIYYRFANNNVLKINLIKLSQNMTYTKPMTISSQSPFTMSENKDRSLCIWRESSNSWHMWGGGGTQKEPYNTYYFHSKDGINWSKPQQCFDEEGFDPFQAIGYSNWHMACKPNYKEKRIEFLCYVTSLNRWEKDAIVYAECDMDKPTILRTPLKEPVLEKSENGWDNGSLYKCSFEIIDTGSNYLYRVWYSGFSKRGKWGLGYTEGLLGTNYTNQNFTLKHGQATVNQ